MSDLHEMASRVAAKFAETTEVGETTELGLQRRRRQKGQARIQRQRRYKKNRSQAKRRAKQYRSRNKAKIKRYEKRRRRNPSQHRLRPASQGLRMLAMEVQFEDLNQGRPGVVHSVNPTEETLQTTLDGEPREYDILDFLDSTVVLDEDDAELYQALDETYEYKPEDDEEEDWDWAYDEDEDDMVYSYDRRRTAARVEQEAMRAVQRSPLWKQLDEEKQKKLLSFLRDPLYAAVFAAKTKADMDKAMESLRQIRGIRDFAHMRRVMGI